MALRVKPSGRQDRLLGAHGGALKVEVRAVPEKGKANRAIVRLLADELGLARDQIEITAGHGSRDKAVVVRGADIDVVIARLEAQGISARVSGEGIGTRARG
jgi:uncharacterized protein (TIGR00251 family)